MGLTPNATCFRKNCPHPTCEGQKLCSMHLESERRRRERRKTPKPEGQCRSTDCGNLSRPGKAWCRRCAERHATNEAKEDVRSRRRNAMRLLRNRVITAYGGECACCGERELRFLTMDHVHGRAKGDKRRGDHLYQWLETHNHPDGFRVLCVNCNWSLGIHGWCPHRALPPDTGALTHTQKYHKNRDREQRLRVHEAYGGGECRCCQENHFEFLSLDHVQEDGAAHRRSLGHVSVYTWAETHNFPPGLQVLCMNCNFAKGIDKECPHQKKCDTWV